MTCTAGKEENSQCRSCALLCSLCDTYIQNTIYTTGNET